MDKQQWHWEARLVFTLVLKFQGLEKTEALLWMVYA